LKILGIVGSPRPGGNTEKMTRMALDEIKAEGIDVELISLAGKKIEPCRGCSACRKTGECVIKDDFGAIYDKMAAAEGFILASPVYFSAPTPQITALISRCFVNRGKGKRVFDNKVGGPIVVARRAGKNFAFAQLLLFYMIQGMIVPGSSYWNVAIGRDIGDVTNDTEGVETIKFFAKKLAWLTKKVNI
jgi:multimeric flavodoxin WrbA